MSTFKCKMCGGALEIENNASIATCEYCGTTQTLPRIDDERKANLYDRANHFRRNNEFDKAMGIYEQILNEDNTDAEAYWSLVLCGYGIEYVEDPVTHKRVPTVNRAQFTSVFDDDNYKSALQYADSYQKSIYEQEAAVINEIQKGILAISQKEAPFDVFICYKETDNNGRRTSDSVLANDLYHQLTQDGFKVFFARITLEDKLGTAYEPYIFAALNSAKVMVVLGTKPEYFNAVWVKNEWSRYLALVKKSGGKKMIIPAYKDMDPYDLPEEFSHLQAQDMSKLGFMQDLIRGIKKLTEPQNANKTVIKETVISGGNANTAPLLKRTFMFLEDGDFKSADEYCEKVLDIDPECAEAYLGKLMVELQVKKQDDLKKQGSPFDNRNNFRKAMRFANENLKAELQGYIELIVNRNLTKGYNEAVNIMQSATTEEDYKKSAEKFKKLNGFKNSEELAKECLEKAEKRRDELNNIKDKCNSLMRELRVAYKTEKDIVKKRKEYSNAINSLTIANDELNSLAETFPKLSQQITNCLNNIASLNQTLSTLQKEKDNIGLFAIKRKKEMKEEIYSIKNKIDHLEQEKRTLEQQRKRYISIEDINKKIEENIQKISNYNKDLNDLEKIRTKEEIIEELTQYDLGKQFFDMFLNFKVGNEICFGKYPQDSDEPEYIHWLVLEVKEGKALVISKYALDCVPYNTERKDVTWETCTLREWLNNGFINSAFSAEESAMIPTVTVSADKNPRYSTNPGNATQDRVFLLSITEANKYFTSDSARICKPTAYAVANGAFGNDSGDCWCWLRSPGFYQSNAAFVYNGGGVLEIGNYVNYGNNAVRPALWIDLDS